MIVFVTRSICFLLQTARPADWCIPTPSAVQRSVLRGTAIKAWVCAVLGIGAVMRVLAQGQSSCDEGVGTGA